MIDEATVEGGIGAGVTALCFVVLRLLWWAIGGG